MIAGLGFGVVDVLAPLRLNQLGATATVIAATFLISAALESGLSPLAGRLSDRRGALLPIRIALSAAVAVSLLVPLLPSASSLVALLIVGMPAYGALFAPATALLSAGVDRLQINQGLGFGLQNLAWACGQALGASASGNLAQLTSDFVPFALLAGACLVTVTTLRLKDRTAPLAGHQRHGPPAGPP